MGCGCGLIGSLVISPGSVSPVYSNPVPRGGGAAIFSLEVLELNAAVSLEITLENKNRGDTSWGTLISLTPISATGVESKHVTGVKELCRVVAQFGTGTSSSDTARIASMNWSWLPYA